MGGVIRDRGGVIHPEGLRGSVSYRVRLIQIAAYKSFEKVVTGFGAAPRYFGLLMIVKENPGIPQTRLAEAIFLDRSSLVPILETLTNQDWVERRATSEDRRVRRVFLTDEGARRLVLLEQEVDRHERIMTDGMTEAEKAELLVSLDRIDANLRRSFVAKPPVAGAVIEKGKAAGRGGNP